MSINRARQFLCEIQERLTDYDAKGVPVLSRSTIEGIARHVLRALDPTALLRPGQTQVAAILSHLRAWHEVDLRFENLGLQRGARILGKVVLSRNQILIDRSLLGEHPAFRFVCAHEIGHWLLHRWRPIRVEDGGEVIEESIDLEDELFALRRGRTLERSRDWIEWQANAFAAGLTMPETTFLAALCETQDAAGIRRNIGIVYLNRDAESQLDYDRTLLGLSQVFGVSRSSIEVRLDTLERLVLASGAERRTDAWRSGESRRVGTNR